MTKPDPAHRATDKRLAALEKRISAEFGRAAREVGQAAADYFSRFAQRDAEQKKLIGQSVNGRIYTEQDYKLWRLAQMGRGKRYEALRDRLAERMTQANQVAAAYINDDMPAIYALNHAYVIEDIKGQAKEMLSGVDFILWDEHTVKRLLMEQPDLLPYYPSERAVKRGIDLAYGKRKVTEYVTQGILQGKSIDQMARSLMDNLEKMERVGAVRAARTAVTAAENAGRQAAAEALERKGVILNKRWIASGDHRTRHAHAEADGQIVMNDMPFQVGGEHLMFPGDTSMGASGWNIYNCRCRRVTEIAGFRSILTDKQRKKSNVRVE